MAEPRNEETAGAIEAASDILAEEQAIAGGQPSVFDDIDLSGFDAISPQFSAPEFSSPSFAPPPSEEAPSDPFGGLDLSGLDSVQPARPASPRAPGVGLFRLPMPGTDDFVAPSIPHPEIEGLEFLGGEVTRLPPELSGDVPESFKRPESRLTEDELQALWYQTSEIYNNTEDTTERVRVLGDFIHEWSPKAAESLGYKPGGEPDPEGLWAVLDGIDKYIDRPLRTLVNTVWDLRKGYAASDLSPEIESPGLDEAWRMLKRNWEDDAGTIEDMEGAMKSLLLFSQNALTGFDDKKALLSEGGYEKAEDEFAASLTEFGWDAAAPVIKLITGASDADIQASIEESISQGSQGGHFTIGLLSGALISPLNFVGGAGLVTKGLGEAATSLLSAGIKLTPRGAAVAAREARLAGSAGRRMLVAELAQEFGDGSIGPLASLSRKVDRAEEALVARELAASTGAARGLALADAGDEIEKITLLRDDLLSQFDDELARVKGGEVLDASGKRIPASALRQDASFRASAVAAANTTEAVNQAFKYSVPLRGAFAVDQLSKLQSFAKAKKIDMKSVNQAWADGLRAADKSDGVLVKVVPTHYGNQIVKSDPIIKSPEVAFIYEKALEGTYGQSARLAALRPEYNSLEKLLRRGVKGVPKLEELKSSAATELRALQKEGMRFAPVRGQIKKTAEQVVERVRGGKEGLKKLRDPKRALLNGENLATNVNPAMFSIAHKLAVSVPWLDRARRTLSGIGRLTRHPQAFTRVNAVTGKLEHIKRADLEHPAKFYSAQKLNRKRASARKVLQARFPMARTALLKISDDPEMLELMNHAAEMGWADPKTAMSSLDEVVTVAAIRKLHEVNQKILDSLSEVTEAGVTVRVLSAEDTERAINALDQLAAVNQIEGMSFPGYDTAMIDDLTRQIAEYGAESERLASLQAMRPALADSADATKDRILKLSMVKKRLQMFGAFYEANMRASMKLQTELRIADMAQARAPEIKAAQEQLIAIERRLKELKTDEVSQAEYSRMIDEVLGTAEDLLPDFSPDEVIPLAVSGKARWIDKAKALPDAELRTHLDNIAREMEKAYGDDAHVIMDRLHTQAELAVKHGIVDKPEQWFYQMDLVVGGDAPSPSAGMLFHETEAAPLFYSRLRQAVEGSIGVTRAEKYLAVDLGRSLRRAGLSDEVVDGLDIDGWLFGQERGLGRSGLSAEEVELLNAEGRLFRDNEAAHIASAYKVALDRVPTSKRARAWGAVAPDKFRVSRGDLHDFLDYKGIPDPEKVLSRLDSRSDTFKIDSVLNEIERGAGVKPAEIKATSLGRYIDRLRDEGQKTVSRGELLDWLDSHSVELVDDVLGHHKDVSFKRGAVPARLDSEEGVRRSLGLWHERVGEGVEEALGEPVEVTGAYYIEEIGRVEVQYRSAESGEFGSSAQFSPDEIGVSVADLRKSDELYERLDNLEFEADARAYAELEAEEAGEAVDVVTAIYEEDRARRASTDARWEDDGFLFLVSPGGEKYSELLLVNPKSSAETRASVAHWPGMKGIEGHLRFNIRTDKKGRRVLYIEELQSDVYQGIEQARRVIKELDGKEFDLSTKKGKRDSDRLRDARFDIGAAESGAIYDGAWVDLLLKRALKFAVEDAGERIDAVAWTTGKTQRARYDTGKLRGMGLAQQYDKVMPAVSSRLFKPHGAVVGDFDFDVTESFAKAKQKAFDSYGDTTRTVVDPATGDEVTFELYKDTVKKMDATAPLVRGERTLKAHGFEITDELRDAVKKDGLALFQQQETVRRGMMKVLEDDRVLIQAFDSANPSTIVHEVGHLLRRNLLDEDQAVVKDWLASESKRLRSLPKEELPKDIAHLFPEGEVGQVVTKDGEFTALGEELFARGFENYLATGKAPRGASAALKKAFKKLKEWVSAAYENILGRNDVQFDDEVKAVLNRYLLGKERPMPKKELWEIPESQLPVGSLDERAKWEAAVRAQIKSGNGKAIPVEVLMSFPEEFLDRVSGSIGSAIPAAKRSKNRLEKARRTLARLKKKLSESNELEAAFVQKEVDKARAAVLSAAKAAEDAANKAGFSKKQMDAMRRKMRAQPKAPKKKEFAIPEGSRERRTLEAMQELYRSRVASIVSEVQEEATLARGRSREQQAAILRSLVPKEKLTKEQAEKVALLARLLGEGADSTVVPKIPEARINELIRLSGDNKKLMAKYRKAQAKIAKLKPEDRPAAEALWDAKLYEQLADIRVKAEDVVELTPLQEAVARYASAGGLGRSRPVAEGMPGQFLSKEELAQAIDNFDSEMDSLIEALEDLDFDLRSPADVRRQLEDSISSSINNLSAAAFDWKGRMEAFADDQAARLLKDMTEDQRLRVFKLVKNPELHDIIRGRKVAVASLTERLANITSKIEAKESAGEPVPSHMLKSRDKIQKHIDIVGDDGNFEKVLDGARVIKKFYDEFLKELKAKGILDEGFNEELFFRRTEVGNYVPHVLSWAAKRKLNSLVGSGVLPSSARADFTKFRKIKGTIAEINEAKRSELASEVVRHQALKGVYGPGVKEAAGKSMSSLREAFEDARMADPAIPEWDALVESARIEFGLDEMYDFFETNPLVLMERYSSIASKKIADAVFIEDILDLFPQGRMFAKMYGPNADVEAAKAGFVKLSKVDHLHAVLMSKLPTKLREFEDYIRQSLTNGTPTNEIMDHLKANGVDVGSDVVNAFATNDVYVPVSVGEYLNWMNGSEAKWGKENLSLSIWDGIHSWMKGQATIIALAHIGRNWIGNVVSASQELGWRAVSPTVQWKAMRIWGSWGDESLDSVVKIGKHEYTVKEWRDIFMQQGFYDTPLSSEMMQETVGLPAASELSTGKTLIRDMGLMAGGVGAGALAGAMFGLAPAGAFAGAAGALLAGRKWSGVKAVKGQNVIERLVGKTMQEMSEQPKEAVAAAGARFSGGAAGALIGTVFAGPIGGLFGSYLFGASMPDYMRMMGGLNQSVEAQARLSMAVAALEQGRSLDDALVSVNKALRDYSDLSPIEKGVLRRMFFFYTWEAGNFKFQLDWMRKHPVAAKQTAAFFNGLYKYQFSEEEIASVPEQWRYRVLLRTGAGKIMAVSGLPMEPMMDILTRGKRLEPRGVATRIHPIPLTMMEWLIGGGHSVYYDKGWDELNNVRAMKNAPPGLKDIIGFPREGTETWVPVYKDGVEVGSRPDYRAENATLFYLMQRFPGWRVMSQYMALSSDTFNSYAMDTAGGPEEAAELQAKWWERALMFTFGYKVSNIDFDQQREYMAWRMEQDLLRELELRKRKARTRVSRLNVEGGWTEPRG